MDRNEIREQNYKLTLEETESYVHWNKESKTAEFYTSDKNWINKIQKMCKIDPKTFKVEKFDKYDYVFRFPKKLITIRLPRIPREMSEEQRQVLRDRLKSICQLKKTGGK